MGYTTPTRPGEPPIPDYVWVRGTPDKHGSTGGCTGCDFRPLSTGIRCSRIPCHIRPGLVARIVKPA